MRSIHIERRGTAVVVVLAAVLAWAAPASAHEEINPPTVTTGRPTFLTLTAIDEKQVDLTTISLTAPPGVPFSAGTHEPAGWTAQRSESTITWSGGRVMPDNFDQWGFEIEGAGTPGILAYKVTLGFADGTSEESAADVTAVAPGTTAQPATTVGGSPAPEASNGRANAALGIAIVAGVLALIAVGLGARRGRESAGSTEDGPKATQEW